jgi:hypothetical protein
MQFNTNLSLFTLILNPNEQAKKKITIIKYQSIQLILFTNLTFITIIFAICTTITSLC